MVCGVGNNEARAAACGWPASMHAEMRSVSRGNRTMVLVGVASAGQRRVCDDQADLWVSRLNTLFKTQAQCSRCFMHANVTLPYPDVGCRYRAVVFGWDRRCRGSGSWVARNQANPEQPYYYCLPDEGDALRRPARGRHMQHTSMQPTPWQCLRSLLLLHCCSAACSEHTCHVTEKLPTGCYLNVFPKCLP